MNYLERLRFFGACLINPANFLALISAAILVLLVNILLLAILSVKRHGRSLNIF